MSEILSAMNSLTIVNLVVFGLVIMAFIVLLVFYLLWKKNKFQAKGNFLSRLDFSIQQTKPLVKRRYISNPNKKELCFYWLIVCLGIANIAMEIITFVVYSTFDIALLFDLIFLFMLVLLSCYDYKLSPVYPYYYEYNPSVFIFAIVMLIYGFIAFVRSMAAGYWLYFLLGTIRFAGLVLFYGLLVLLKYFKKEFKPLNLLIYLGAIVMTGIDAANFGLSLLSRPSALPIVVSGVSLTYSIAITLLILYVYDKFTSIKKLFHR